MFSLAKVSKIANSIYCIVNCHNRDLESFFRLIPNTYIYFNRAPKPNAFLCKEANTTVCATISLRDKTDHKLQSIELDFYWLHYVTQCTILKRMYCRK